MNNKVNMDNERESTPTNIILHAVLMKTLLEAGIADIKLVNCAEPANSTMYSEKDAVISLVVSTSDASTILNTACPKLNEVAFEIGQLLGRNDLGYMYDHASTAAGKEPSEKDISIVYLGLCARDSEFSESELKILQDKYESFEITL